MANEPAVETVGAGDGNQTAAAVECWLVVAAAGQRPLLLQPHSCADPWL